MADLIETDVEDVEKARQKGLLPKGGRKRTLLRNTLTNARASRERAASNSYYRDRVDMTRKRVPGSAFRSGPEQHESLSQSLAANLKLGRRYSKIAGYLQSRGVRKSDTDTLDGLYEAIEKASGLMRLSNKRNQFRAGSGTKRATQSLRRISGQTKRQSRSLGKRISALGGIGDKRDLRNKLSDVEHRRARVATAISYLRRRSKRNANTKGSGYDDR